MSRHRVSITNSPRRRAPGCTHQKSAPCLECSLPLRTRKFQPVRRVAKAGSCREPRHLRRRKSSPHSESFTFVQGFSLSLPSADTGRRAKRESALHILLSAAVRLEVGGSPEGHEGELPSRAGPSAKSEAVASSQSRERRKPLPEARVASQSPNRPDIQRDAEYRFGLRRTLGQYTCSGSWLRPLPAAGTLRCMKYRPVARLRPPLIGITVAKGQ